MAKTELDIIIEKLDELKNAYEACWDRANKAHDLYNNCAGCTAEEVNLRRANYLLACEASDAAKQAAREYFERHKIHLMPISPTPEEQIDHIIEMLDIVDEERGDDPFQIPSPV